MTLILPESPIERIEIGAMLLTRRGKWNLSPATGPWPFLYSGGPKCEDIPVIIPVKFIDSIRSVERDTFGYPLRPYDISRNEFVIVPHGTRSIISLEEGRVEICVRNNMEELFINGSCSVLERLSPLREKFHSKPITRDELEESWREWKSEQALALAA